MEAGMSLDRTWVRVGGLVLAGVLGWRLLVVPAAMWSECGADAGQAAIYAVSHGRPGLLECASVAYQEKRDQEQERMRSMIPQPSPWIPDPVAEQCPNGVPEDEMHECLDRVDPGWRERMGNPEPPSVVHGSETASAHCPSGRWEPHEPGSDFYDYLP
jgi:hypothetical protein